jgi:hypothetical protein
MDTKCNAPPRSETEKCTYIPVVIQPVPPPPHEPETEQPPVTEEPPLVEQPSAEQPAELITNNIYYIIGGITILIVISGIGFVVHEMKASKSKLDAEKKKKNAEDETYMRLISYVRQTIQQGYPADRVRNELLREGWSANIVNEVFNRLKR